MAHINNADGGIYYRLEAKGSQDHDEKWDDGAGGEVKEICICHGKDLIYSFQASYERHGTTLISRRHGGNEGNFDIITLNGPLKWVSGHYSSWCWDSDEIFVNEDDNPEFFCKVIRSLKFGTDNATYGPFGAEHGVPFYFKSSTISISGFHGRSNGSFLNSIGVYVKSMAKGHVDDPFASKGLIGSSEATSAAITSSSDTEKKTIANVI